MIFLETLEMWDGELRLSQECWGHRSHKIKQGDQEWQYYISRNHGFQKAPTTSWRVGASCFVDLFDLYASRCA